MLNPGRYLLVVQELPFDEADGDIRTHFRAVRVTTPGGQHLVMLVEPPDARRSLYYAAPSLRRRVLEGTPDIPASAAWFGVCQTFDGVMPPLTEHGCLVFPLEPHDETPGATLCWRDLTTLGAVAAKYGAPLNMLVGTCTDGNSYGLQPSEVAALYNHLPEEI